MSYVEGKSLGINGCIGLANWIADWLRNTEQRVVLAGCNSKWNNIKDLESIAEQYADIKQVQNIRD